jgi:hypothetical protein
MENEKKIIFITGLHNTPHGCGASVASAAGPPLQKNCPCVIVQDIKEVEKA